MLPLTPISGDYRLLVRSDKGFRLTVGVKLLQISLLASGLQLLMLLISIVVILMLVLVVFGRSREVAGLQRGL